MTNFSFFVCLQFFVVCAFARSKTHPLPSYIKPCSASAPDFEKCCLEHGRAALPFIFKGDKKVGIPNMLPLIVPEVNINAGPSLQIFLRDVQVHGLDKTDLKEVKIDIKNSKINFKCEIPVLELEGKYEVDGKIMVLPIKGNGDMNITAIGGKYHYFSNYDIEKINGLDHLQLTEKDTLDFNLQRIQIHLDNLFDGDKKLGDQMNNFLNENWKDIVDEFGLPISETIRSIGRSIASAYFKKIPYHELILD